MWVMTSDLTGLLVVKQSFVWLYVGRAEDVLNLRRLWKMKKVHENNIGGYGD